MCAKQKHLPEREELVERHVELEQENRRLWDELKEKKSQIVALNDKIILQEELLKSKAELKRQLCEYLDAIRSLQKNVTFLQNENKILEEKFYKSQLAIKRINAGDSTDQRELLNENATLKMKMHSLEKEMRRFRNLWDKNNNITTDIMFARDTIQNLEQKLMECQPLASECKQIKIRLSDCEEKLKSATFTNSVLKDELHKIKTKTQDTFTENEHLKQQNSKFTEIITRLKEENTSMEHFVEKSFRLEGALAELDDLNVVLKKQESMLGVLFDENQSLKEGISHLFDDINLLKDRNWKLERYANDMEASYYRAEKNIDALEKRVEYFQSMLTENDRIKLVNEDVLKHNSYLENTNNVLMTKLSDMEKSFHTSSHTLNVIKEENQKLIKENASLRAELMDNNRKFVLENDMLKAECEKQKTFAAKYNSILADLRALQRKHAESQEISSKMKDEVRRLSDENSYLRDQMDALSQKTEALKADRERCQKDLRNAQAAVKEAEACIKQLEYQLHKPRHFDPPNYYQR